MSSITGKERKKKLERVQPIERTSSPQKELAL